MYIGRGWGHNVNSAQGPITPWASPGAVQRTYLQLLWQLMKWPLEAPQTPKKHLITFLAFFSKFPSLLCKCMASVSPPPTAEHCFPFSHDAAALLIWRWMQFASTSRNSITGTKKAPLKPQFDFLLFGQQSNHGPFIHANSAKFNAQCLLPWIWTTETNHRECCWETARGVFTVRQPECLQQSTPSAWSTVRKQINVLWMLDCQTVPRHGMQTNRCPPPVSLYLFNYTMAAYSTCAPLEEKQQWRDEVIKECTFIERHTLKNLLLFSFLHFFLVLSISNLHQLLNLPHICLLYLDVLFSSSVPVW